MFNPWPCRRFNTVLIPPVAIFPALHCVTPGRYRKGARHGRGILTVTGLPAPACYALTGEWQKGELNGRVTVTWGRGCQLQANVSNGTMVAPAFAVTSPGSAFILLEGGWYAGGQQVQWLRLTAHVFGTGGWSGSCADGIGTLAFYDGSTYRFRSRL
jgi:hypothetical protein